MANYIKAISLLSPNTICYAPDDGTNYYSIIHVSGDAIPNKTALDVYISTNPNLDNPTDNYTISNSLSLPSSSGQGILIDNNYGWVDLIGDVTPKVSGNTSAVYRNFIGLINGWTHQASAEGDLQYHIPHDYAPNKNLFVHVHWGHNGTAISGNLNITFYATYAKRSYPATAFVTPITLTLAAESLNMTNSVRYCHRVDEIQLSTIGGSASQLDTSNLEVDGLIGMHYIINTIPSISGSSISNLPYIFTIDIHMQSTGIGTRLKDPGYYL